LSCTALIVSSNSYRKVDWGVGRVFYLPYPDAVFRRLMPHIRMPIVFLHVMAAGTATYIDSIPSTPHDSKETDDDNLSEIGSNSTRDAAADYIRFHSTLDPWRQLASELRCVLHLQLQASVYVHLPVHIFCRWTLL
jgi:hypothetical protein